METLVLFLLFTVLYGEVAPGQGFIYDSYTGNVLCSTQCGALCMENESYCNTVCLPQLHTWTTKCDNAGCEGTCDGLQNFFNQSLLPEVPVLNRWHVLGNKVMLSWQPSQSTSRVLYAVQYKKVHDQSWKNALFQLQTTFCIVEIEDVCNDYNIRVIAINRHGSQGFSNYLRIPASAFHLDVVPHVEFVGQGIYYYPGTREFMAVIQWDDIPGWSTAVDYYWNEIPMQKCNNKMTNIMPLFQRGTNSSTSTHHRILMHISADAYGCLYQGQVRAETTCGLRGPWKNFTLDLTDCQAIYNFPCSAFPTTFSPPGNAENVSLCVEYGGVNATMWIRLWWDPPTDLGSMGFINHYTIRYGKVALQTLPIPPIFIEPVPRTVHIANDSIEVDITVSYEDMSEVYGFQVVPVAPNHQIKDKEWGLFEVYTIQISNLYSHNVKAPSGKILLDEAGVRVVQIPNALSVDIMWQPRMMPGSAKHNACHDHYSLQLGRVVRDKMLRPHLTDTTVQYIPGNVSNLLLDIKDIDVEYGFKIQSMDENETVSDEQWDEAELHIFKIQTSDPDKTAGTGELIEVLVVSLVLVSLGVLIPTALLVRRKIRNRTKFSHLGGQRGTDTNNYQVFFLPSSSSMSSVITPALVSDMWELPHSGVKVGRILGQGAFGLVAKGRISGHLLTNRNIPLPPKARREGTEISVAIKMLKDDDDRFHKIEFLREIALMKKIGYHRNIVSMLGCCTLCDPVCLLVEHMANGDLLSFLKSVRTSMRERDHTHNGYVNRDVDLLGPTDLLSFARQVTLGMEFLAQKGFVHRDLAARNVLVGKDKTVKIGDFGLTRFVYNDAVYVNRKGGRLPLKWMSLEAICDLTFSTASDVWSFGVVLFEIVTLGGTPYPTVDMHDLVKLLKQGYRMDKPPNCSQDLYKVMQTCWQELPKLRPSFTDLKLTLDTMLEENCDVDYLCMDIDASQYYYTMACGDEELPTNYTMIADADTDTSERTQEGCSCDEKSEANIDVATEQCSSHSDGMRAATPENDGNCLDCSNDNISVIHEVQMEINPSRLTQRDSGFIFSPVSQPLECIECPIREHRDSGIDTSSYSGSSTNASPRTLSSRGSQKESSVMEDEVFMRSTNSVLSESMTSSTNKSIGPNLSDWSTDGSPVCKKCLSLLTEEFHFCDKDRYESATVVEEPGGHFSWGCRRHGLDPNGCDSSACSTSVDTLASWDENTLDTYL